MKKLLTLFILAFSLSINAQDSTKVDNFQKTDETLSEVVKKALNVAEKTGDFVVEQAPLLLQEFYKWQIYSKIFFILLGISIIFLGIKLPYLWLDKEQRSWDYKYFSRYGDDGAISAWFFCSVSLLFGIVIILANIYYLIYVLTAPKLYLIEYFIK